MNLRIFRSLWGLEESWRTFFPKLKAHGFHGVEASLIDIRYPNTSEFSQLLQANDLNWICGLYTSWDDYLGDPTKLTIQNHITNFKAQLIAALSITPKPIHINVHSGSDDFTPEEAQAYFKEVLPTQARICSNEGVGPIVSHEGHRGRILYSPWTTLPLLQKFPDLKITLDLGHWTVVTERILRPEEIQMALERTTHIHARVAAPELGQINCPGSSVNRCWTEGHSRVWDAVWREQLKQNRPWATITPEYGPLITTMTGDGWDPNDDDPYKNEKNLPQKLDNLIFEEGQRLRDRFDKVVKGSYNFDFEP